MGEIFANVLELDSVTIFAVTRLIRDCTLTHYDEPDSTYTKKVLHDKYREDIVNDREYRGSLSIPKFCKQINHI